MPCTLFHGTVPQELCSAHLFHGIAPQELCSAHFCFRASSGGGDVHNYLFQAIFLHNYFANYFADPSGAPRNKHNYFPGNSCVRNSWPQKIVVRPDAEIVVRSKKLCKNSCAPKLTCARTRKIVVRSKQGCAKICTHN